MPETPRTIGIIEDDESVRRALRRLFLSIGFEVQVFVTAEEFLQSLSQMLPSCLVLDVNLPGLSGLELQQRLCTEGWHVPIVIITAYASDKVREQAIRAGAIAFLPKPFDESSLLQAVFGAMT